jgi:phosphoribosylanthranilate isomerase
VTTPLIKICGITRMDDALAAVDAGADFIGLVFADGSRRRLELDDAAKIVQAAKRRSTSVRVVGVFRNAPLGTIRLVVSYASLDLVQLHGEEEDAMMRELATPSIKAIRVERDVPDDSPFISAAWILYDSFSTAAGGGTGRTFDWSLLQKRPAGKPFFLAGGLTPENVAEAIDLTAPDAIDVSSGVESAPGIKDLHKLQRLFKAVR